MAENNISYLNRNFDDYKQSIIDITKTYYPDVFASLSDASIGAWLIDILADVGDNLNYHIDRTVQETSLDSAKIFSSIQDMARTNGLRIPYKKAALVEIELSCTIPLYEQGSAGSGNLSDPDEKYCPYIKRGTQFSNGTTTFELTNDVDFKEQFNDDGISNRQIIPNRNTNGNIVSYTYKKLAIASACQTKVMKMVITNNDLKPFMEVLINDTNVIGVDSIIVKDGTNINTDPELNEYFVDEEEYKDKKGMPVVRFFEVDNLIDQYRFGYEVQKTASGNPIGDTFMTSGNNKDVKFHNYYNPIWEVSEKIDAYEPDPENVGAYVEKSYPVRLVARGKWKRLKHKFITEYTDGWKLKVIFGPGIENQYGEIPTNASEFTQYQMSRMMANDYMGVLPKNGTTMYILYKVGGGEISNIATDTLTNIIGLNVEIDGNCDEEDQNVYAYKIRSVKDSLKVTNTTPSYGGKNEPTTEEIRHMIKYNTSAQNRCVTVKDYQSKINEIPAKFGCPFRHSVIEENNKVVIYTLGLDYEGHLTNFLSETVAENIKEFLSNYKMINDFIEIKSGKIINLSFRVKVYIDKSYDKSDVVKNVIDLIYDYMDIRRHLMGEDIFIGDLQKEISKLDGVINLVYLKIFNNVGGEYSENVITQQFIDPTMCNEYGYDETNLNVDNEIDLRQSDYMLFSEANSMFEIKYKNRDIVIEVMTRN